MWFRRYVDGIPHRIYSRNNVIQRNETDQPQHIYTNIGQVANRISQIIMSF